MSKAKDSINALSHALTASTHIGMARWLMLLVMDILSSLTLPLLRKDFGERFFSPFWIFVMMIATIAICLQLNVNTTIINIYMGLLTVVCLYHLAVIFIRNHRKTIWHTRYEGESNFLSIFRYLPKGTRAWWIEGLYEPMLVFAVGSLIYLFIDAGLGTIFLLSSTAMMLRSRIRYWVWRESILDERDLMIESEYTLEALNGASPKDTKGYVVHSAVHMTPHEKRAKAKRMLTPEEFAKHYPEPPKDFSYVKKNNTETKKAS